MTRADINFLFKMMRSGWLSAAQNKGALIAHCASFAIIMLTTGYLLMHVDFTGKVANPPTPSQMVWYLITTEIVLMSQIALRSDIIARVYNGQMMFEMGYPRPLWQLHIPYMIGMGFFYAPVLQIFGFLWAYIITGAPPPFTLAWLWLPFGIFCAIGLYSIFTFFVALAELRWQIGSSFRLMLGKLFFFFGGIQVPPTLFPGLLGTIIPFLPFAAFLYAAAAPHVAGTSAMMVWPLLLQPVWFYILLKLVQRFARATERELQETGGL